MPGRLPYHRSTRRRVLALIAALVGLLRAHQHGNDGEEGRQTTTLFKRPTSTWCCWSFASPL